MNNNFEEIRTILIGLGNIGMGYDFNNSDSDYLITHAKALVNHKNYKLIAAVDSDKEKSWNFKKKYGITSYISLSECLKKESADLYVIATPNNTHKEIFEKIIENKTPVAILFEKPFTNSFDEANTIVDCCFRNGVKVFVNYIRRCDPGVINIKNKLKNNQYKYPIKGICFYTNGLYNNASHFINLLQYWFGDVKKIVNIEYDYFLNYKTDKADFILNFESGPINFFSIPNEEYTHNEIRIFFESGLLTSNKQCSKFFFREIIKDDKLSQYKVISDKFHTFEHSMNVYQYNVFTQLRNNLLKLKNNICTGEEALLTLKCLDNISSK